MRGLLLSGLIMMCVGALLLAACEPAPVAVPTTATPTVTAFATPTLTPTPTLTATPTPTPTPMSTDTPEPTATPTTLDQAKSRLSDLGLSEEIVYQCASTIAEDGVISGKERRLLADIQQYAQAQREEIARTGLLDENYVEKCDPTQILDDLSTPYNVVFYLNNFYRYGGSGPVVYLPAVQAIENKEGRCIDYSQIGATALRNHGFEAYNMGVHITSPHGHNVTAFRDADEKIYVITNGTGQGDQQGAVLLGPYSSWLDAGNDIVRRGYARQGDGDIRLVNPYAITVPRGDILDFPWVIIGR